MYTRSEVVIHSLEGTRVIDVNSPHSAVISALYPEVDEKWAAAAATGNTFFMRSFHLCDKAVVEAVRVDEAYGLPAHAFHVKTFATYTVPYLIERANSTWSVTTKMCEVSR